MIYVLQSIYGKYVGLPNILGLLLILRFSFSVGSGTDTEGNVPVEPFSQIPSRHFGHVNMTMAFQQDLQI